MMQIQYIQKHQKLQYKLYGYNSPTIPQFPSQILSIQRTMLLLSQLRIGILFLQVVDFFYRSMYQYIYIYLFISLHESA